MSRPPLACDRPRSSRWRVAACVARGMRRGTGRRVIVLGFDGLDYQLTARLMERGPAAELRAGSREGGVSPLATTMPPQSPVAWSTFITGLDPGAHGIFDFIHRDPADDGAVPVDDEDRERRPHAHARPWQFPLTGGRVELLRAGEPFWERLEAPRRRTSIMRMPANFPPSGTATRELSGMGTPDILGTYGTFTFYTSRAVRLRGPHDCRRHRSMPFASSTSRAKRRSRAADIRSAAPRQDDGRRSRLHRSGEAGRCSIIIGGQQRLLRGRRVERLGARRRCS